MTSDRLPSIERALWRTGPHQVADAARQALTSAFGARDVELWLADYQIDYLVPVCAAARPLRIESSLAGRAFAAQRPVPEQEGGEHRLHLPLTVYGDRLGVLTAICDGPPDAATAEELAAAATIVARALAVADTRTDVFRRARRRVRLTLAAEIQWELLPGRSCRTDHFWLAGQLEPAYAVWGDNFDWAASPDHLIVSVTNGMGQGIDAALLTQLTIGALRNARRSDADLPEQAALANEAIYTQHRGDRHVGTLLLRFDLRTGRVAAIDAGSPQLYRLRDGAVTPIELDPQLPLGMFNDTEYEEQEFTVRAGDRLIVVSDGAHNSLAADGQVYGTFTLPRVLSRTRLQSPPEVVRTLMHELLAHTLDARLADDAVIVCLDWTGAPDQTPEQAPDQAFDRPER
ncbi:PP2C family protein-serine/threonine phosphatase [Actinomadura hibisca]|uniref:PP2C family protein-serine/threonine phosphatase n=1 Tax=Actinomadura hibisca TaxID=68565 RepID=UPI000831AB29|nr:PP2C family protein-serine/threonine phosphatase [Actinomadura hibisca]